MAGELRRLFISLGIKDTLTPKLTQINKLTNQTATRMAMATAATERQGIAGRALSPVYYSLKDRVNAYATSFTMRMTTLNAKLEEHRMKLLLVGGALAGVVGLTLKGAIAEEGYRQNIKSLAGVIDYQKEGQEQVNQNFL
jgi:hypothetical protein